MEQVGRSRKRDDKRIYASCRLLSGTSFQKYDNILVEEKHKSEMYGHRNCDVLADGNTTTVF